MRRMNQAVIQMSADDVYEEDSKKNDDINIIIDNVSVCLSVCLSSIQMSVHKILFSTQTQYHSADCCLPLIFAD